ncbi:MAG: PglZ domain-containing protein [Myxococcota bacterium]
MKVSAYIVNRLHDLVNDHRVVVWYDPSRAFADLVDNFGIEGVDVVDASTSLLAARRIADEKLARMNELGADRRCLVVYLPAARPVEERTRMRDPFESFAMLGAAFGANEGESLLALARAALPGRVSEIERMFREGRPSLAVLDRLDAGDNFPVIRAALGTDNAVEVAARLIAHSDEHRRLDKTVAGFSPELIRLLRGGLGYVNPALSPAPDVVIPALRQFVLLSEFAFDLPEALPASIRDLPRASAEYRPAIYALAERLRGSDEYQDAYVVIAAEVEAGLRLEASTRGVTHLGQRDTFAFENDWALARVASLSEAGKLDEATSLAAARRKSVWRRQAERDLRWTVAERGLALLRGLAEWEERRVSGNAALVEHVRAYTQRDDGLWNVDRAHRELEQAAARCSGLGDEGKLLERARLAWRAAANTAQDAFLKAVEREGWPPSGVHAQVRTWERHVEPALAEGQRVAYFLVDAMRYEMGRALRSKLEELGGVTIEAAATVVPTTTPFGMAALMPGAAGALRATKKGDDLVPTIAGKVIESSSDRMAWIRERLGDQFVDVTLDEVVDASQRKKLAQRVANARLIVVKTQDIDELGEGQLLRARRHMSEVPGDLLIALQTLAGLGIERAVLAADHGHVLMPEVLPGDRVSEPPGTWLKAKRRCRIGSQLTSVPNVLTLSTAHMGLDAPVPDFAVPRGFRVFTDGPGYFHEGISLQECLVPIISVRLRAAKPVATDRGTVKVLYGKDRFTTIRFAVKLRSEGATEGISVKVEIVDAAGKEGRVVGSVLDSDLTDALTGATLVAPGAEVPVVVEIDENFEGAAVEIRVRDAQSGAVLNGIKIKNGIIG